MKTAGILGGLGYESTIEYYKSILGRVYEARASYPNLFINSVDIKTMLGFLERGDHKGLASFLADGINALARGGCALAAIASNTPHVVIAEVRALAEIPVLSIIDCTVEAIQRSGCSRVGVLGTMFTLRGGLYSTPLERNGVEAIVPDEADASYMNEKIFNELEYGIVKSETRARFVEIVRRMRDERGIEGLILGCTELPMILSEQDLPDLRLFNTTDIHIERLVGEILG